MIDKKMYQKIQRLKRQGYGKSKISRLLKMDPATIRRYFNMSPEDYHKYQFKIRQKDKMFDRFKDEILKIYKENGNNRLNMSAVYDYLEEKFNKLSSSEKSLRNYIHYLESTGLLEYSTKIRLYNKVPKLPYGKQMQLDFGEYKTTGGIKLYIFGIVLSACRYKYIAFQDKPFKTTDVILHLLDAFDYFDGYAKELVIDQDSLMVVSENYGEIIFTKQFEAFIKEMGIKMYVCRKADPESKGKVENLIKYVQYNFLQVRNFNNVEDVKESLRRWLKRRANGKISQATGKIPSMAIEEERIYLKPVKNSIFRKNRYIDRQKRTVSDKSFIMIDSKEYSVPIEYRMKDVEYYKTDDEIFIFNINTNKQIAGHNVLKGTLSRAVKMEHFRYKSMHLKELEANTFALFSDNDKWREFVKQTKKIFHRYSRDQYALALNVFSSEKNPKTFQRALDYCIENKTFGMKALYDTYEHFGGECKEKDQMQKERIITGKFKQINIQAVKVTARNVGCYEALVKKAGGY